MSYRRKLIKSKIDKIKAKKPVFKCAWFWIVVLCLVFIAVGSYFVLFYPGLQIKSIVISGNSIVKTQDLQKIILEDSSTGLINFWNVKINSRSIFLINADKIKNDILSKFSDIDKLIVNRNFPQTLSFNITERQSLGVFCNSVNECFSIDKNGIIFGSKVSSTENTTIIKQSAINNPQVLIGKQAISKTIMDAILNIKNDLKDNFQIDIETALIASATRLNISTSENWKVYLDLDPDYDINTQIKKLNLLLDGGISSTSRKNLRYIDLRPQGRAIVCDNKICGG